MEPPYEDHQTVFGGPSGASVDNEDVPRLPVSPFSAETVGASTAGLVTGARRGRERLVATGRTRWRRVRASGWQIGQCAAGAGLAWWLAHALLHHQQPFFAPVAAIVTLGLNWGARLGRLFEIVLGVSIGILLGELLVKVVGHGYWQLPLVVALSMTTAVFVGAGALLSTQAGVQAVMVTVLIPGAQQGISRWEDALIGGSLGILIAALAPTSAPLVRPRELATEAVRETAALLTECAEALEEHDLDRARHALERARAGQQGRIDDLRSAAEAGLDVVAMSPWFQRRHRPALRRIAELAGPLDLAMRNERIVVRRVVAVVRRGDPVSPQIWQLLHRIADACEQVARDIGDGKHSAAGIRLLREAARFSTRVPVGEVLTVDVLLEQTRTMVVDLLQVAGLGYDASLEAIARPQEPGPLSAGL